MQKYFNKWKSRDDVAADYKENTPADEEIVYACYEAGGYEGSAIVVYQRDGKLYENNDSHCSCHGLEEWRPEETSVAALLMRKEWPGLREALERLSA